MMLGIYRSPSTWNFVFTQENIIVERILLKIATIHSTKIMSSISIDLIS